jgi:hypothetical protein
VKPIRAYLSLPLSAVLGCKEIDRNAEQMELRNENVKI